MKLAKLYESVLKESQVESCLINFANELSNSQVSTEGDDYLTVINRLTLPDRITFISANRTLKSCVSSYTNVLQPEGVVYMGLNIPLRELLSQYEDIADDLNNGGVFDFIYTSPLIIQNWMDNEDSAEDSTKVSPFLLQLVNKYKVLGDNQMELAKYTSELYTNMNDISVPIVIRMNSNSDDFLFKTKYLKSLSKYESELVRFNNQPTRVSGVIIHPLFKPLYGMLTLLRKYEGNLHREGK